MATDSTVGKAAVPSSSGNGGAKRVPLRSSGRVLALTPSVVEGVNVRRFTSAAAHVRFGPIADSSGEQKRSLFDQLVCDGEHARRNGEAERLGGLEVDHELEFGGLYDRQITRLLAL